MTENHESFRGNEEQQKLLERAFSNFLSSERGDDDTYENLDGYFNEHTSQVKFLKNWNQSYVNESIKKKMLHSRELWFEMKKKGQDFEEFLEKSILEDAGKNLELGGRNSEYLYRKILVYTGLAYPNSVKFFKNLLTYNDFVSNIDTGSVRAVVGFLKKVKGADSVQAVLTYLETLSKANVPDEQFTTGFIIALSALEQMMETKDIYPAMKSAIALSRDDEEYLKMISQHQEDPRLNKKQSELLIPEIILEEWNFEKEQEEESFIEELKKRLQED